jgi:hypothetical protein
MEHLRRWMMDQGRNRARWTAIFMALLLVTLVWPTVSQQQEWAKTQIVWLWAFALAFQFGGLLQAWKAHRAMLSVREETLGFSVPEGSTDLPPSFIRSRSLQDGLPSRLQSGIEIRSYANLDDAKSHGWEFSDPIARLDEQPVPSEASFRGASYAFDGLLPARLLGAVPKDMRVFGRLCYRLLVIQPASVPPTSMTATSLPQAPLPPATLNPAA